MNIVIFENDTISLTTKNETTPTIIPIENQKYPFFQNLGTLFVSNVNFIVNNLKFFN